MSEARRAALELFSLTVQEGAYPNLIFEEKTRALEDRDRRFVTRLVNDTLTNLIHIDYIIAQFVGKQRIKPVIRDILRLGVDQLKFLGLEPYAAIDQSVQLTREMKKNQLTGFVNGVLRNIQRTPEIKYPQEGTMEYVGITCSKPGWLLELWEKDYGKQKAIAFAKTRQSKTVVRQNRHRDFDLGAWLTQEGYGARELFAGCYELESSYGIPRSQPFLRGDISIQGLGSQLACYALRPRGEILDACAAPGGKTLLLSELTGGGKITACDLYEHRLELIAAQLHRGGHKARLVQQDMSQRREDFLERFECVLVDAPCTGLGMLDRKPDILLNRKAEDVNTLAGIQKKILDNCGSYVKSGGALVYSTCSLNKTENDGVLDWFLQKNHDFSLDSFVLPNGTKSEGKVQLTPDKFGEGFFIARMVRA